VRRGGGWDGNAAGCTVSYRGYHYATYGDGSVGFRLCRIIP